MARPPAEVPPLRIHKASGRGYAHIDGKRYYLGKYGDPETREAYARLIAEWTACDRRLPHRAGDDLRIVELCDAFNAYAENYYRRPDRTPTAEVGNFKRINAELIALYGRTPAREFGPMQLLAVRGRFVAKGWSRGGVNRGVNSIRHVFKWAVSRQLVTVSVLEALQTVESLRRGRTEARESPAVKPVAMEHVNAIQEHVSRQVWALVQLQLFTGARAGELLGIRPVDLDKTGKVWVYRPTWHKNAHRGQDRTIYIGPKGQEVIRPFLGGRAVDAPLFSPAEANAERRIELHKKRETPLSCGNKPGTNRRRNPQVKPGPVYTTGTYRRAIARGCDAVNERIIANASKADAPHEPQLRLATIPHWHPHQLRHTAATLLEREFGIDTAAIILGHSSPVMTRVYAERDHTRALEVMSKIG